LGDRDVVGSLREPGSELHSTDSELNLMVGFIEKRGIFTAELMVETHLNSHSHTHTHGCVV